MVLPSSPYATKHVSGLTRRRGSLIPEFVEVQRKSFSLFLEKGVGEELSKINPIWDESNGVGVLLYPDRYLLLMPTASIRESFEKGKTYGCKLYILTTFLLRGDPTPTKGEPTDTSRQSLTEGARGKLASLTHNGSSQGAPLPLLRGPASTQGTYEGIKSVKGIPPLEDQQEGKQAGDRVEGDFQAGGFASLPQPVRLPQQHRGQGQPLVKQSLPGSNPFLGESSGEWQTRLAGKVDAPSLRSVQPPTDQPFPDDILEGKGEEGQREEIDVEQGKGGGRSNETTLSSPWDHLTFSRESHHTVSLSRQLFDLPSPQTAPCVSGTGSTVVSARAHWVSIGTLPMMTKRGHFVVNGVLRVLMNQLTRCPGVYFHEHEQELDQEDPVTNPDKLGRHIYADVICRRGAWLRIQTDKKKKGQEVGQIWAHLKRTRKVRLDTLANALATYEQPDKNLSSLEQLDIELSSRSEKEPEKELEKEPEKERKRVSAYKRGSAYKKRPAQKTPKESVQKGRNFLLYKFKNPRSYDLGEIGRQRINSKLSLSVLSLQLTSADLRAVAEHMKELLEGRAQVDDIDHLGNRRVRASGEVLQAQFETGLYRLERVVASNLSKLLTKSSTLASLTPADLFSTRPLNGALRELFGSSPLSQYMDQTNPLSEVTHKRRFTSLGPGGVSRDTAGMQVRGIHPTHYGRICPIETPEGKNAGLVNSPTLLARVNKEGFLEAPCYPVVLGQVQKGEGVIFLSAEREGEEGVAMAPGDLRLSGSHLLQEGMLPVRVVNRYQEEFQQGRRERVGWVATTPTHLLSVATALIPFLEHNDANRALMGSNMQRQAVPLLQPERPLVGTGLEAVLVGESGHIVQSATSGYVSYVSGKKIIIAGGDLTSGLLAPSDLSSPLRGAGLGGPLSCSEAPAAFTLAFNPFALPPLGDKQQLPQLCWGQSLLRGDPGSELPQQGWGKREPPHRQAEPLERGYKIEVRRGTLPPGEGPRSPEGDDQRSPTALEACWQAPSLAAGCQERGWLSRAWHDRLQGGGRDVAGHGPSSCVVDSHYSSFVPPFQQAEVAAAYPLKGVRVGGITPSRRGLGHRLPLTWKGWQGGREERGGRRSAQESDLFERGLSRQALLAGCQPPLFLLGGPFLRGSTRQPPLSFTAYLLQQHEGSNQRTCIAQRPSVCEGEWVQRGDILADCASSDKGELALGKNITVAYLPWEGYNFEDAVVISERLSNQEVYTSLHIRRYEAEARKTEYGREKITTDLRYLPLVPRIGLDIYGLAICGRWVEPGDILVRKATPIEPLVLTPHERLAYDVAGFKVPRFRETSVRVTEEGQVIMSKILETDLPPPSSSPLLPIPLRARVYVATKRRIRIGDKVSGRHGNKGIVSTVRPREDMPYLPDGKPVDMVLNPLGVPSRMNVGQVIECLLGLAASHLGQRFKMTPFDEMYGPEASRSLVYLKLYQARLTSGHRWLFDPAFPGKTRLLDGRTGLSCDQSVTVGQAYMLKLIHMVTDKMHSRATGPYSLVTRQPLGGKSHKGGQRVGEMEVWALEGFGAAYNLQEMLTCKSDDVSSRLQLLNSLIYKQRLALGTPEAFRVMARELQALCINLDVYVVKSDPLFVKTRDVNALT